MVCCFRLYLTFLLVLSIVVDGAALIRSNNNNNNNNNNNMKIKDRRMFNNNNNNNRNKIDTLAAKNSKNSSNGDNIDKCRTRNNLPLTTPVMITALRARLSKTATDDEGTNHHHRRSVVHQDETSKSHENNNKISDMIRKNGTFLAAVFTTFILLTLAGSTSDVTAAIVDGESEAIGKISTNIIRASVPSSFTDVVSIALGEGAAASLGLALSYLFINGQQQNGKSKGAVAAVFNGNNELIADAEFFFNRALISSLMLNFELSDFKIAEEFLDSELLTNFINIPSISVTLLATIPYFLTKWSREIPNLGDVYKRMNGQEVPIADTNIDAAANTEEFDYVNLFADITKWLEYDVLKNDFRGLIIPMSDSAESALFGALCTISSAIYADLLYNYTELGSPGSSKIARERPPSESFRRYAYKGLSACVIFGVYELGRSPLAEAILGFLIGGVDSYCVGSERFDICMETYALLNEPGAGLEGQLRAFIVAVYGFFDRAGVPLESIIGSGSMFDERLGTLEFTRGVIVSVYSFVHEYAPFLEDAFSFY